MSTRENKELNTTVWNLIWKAYLSWKNYFYERNIVRFFAQKTLIKRALKYELSRRLSNMRTAGKRQHNSKVRKERAALE